MLLMVLFTANKLNFEKETDKTNYEIQNGKNKIIKLKLCDIM